MMGGTVGLLLLALAWGDPASAVQYAHVEAEDAYIVYPMEVWNNSGVVSVGADATNCSSKDPHGKQLSSPHPVGYVIVEFTLPHETWVSIDVRVRAPDSLSDSFWARLNGGPPMMWSMAQIDAWVTTSFAPYAQADHRITQACHRGRAGRNNLTIFIREPGALLDYLTVRDPSPPAISVIEGCSGACSRAGGSIARLTVDNLCGPDAISTLEIEVGGLPCIDIRYEEHNVVSCRTPSIGDGGTLQPVRVVQDGVAIEGTVQYQETRDHVRWIEVYWYVLVVCGLAVLCLGGVVGYHSFTMLVIKSETRPPPTGLTALVITDVESSTLLWEKHPEAMASALQVHDNLMRSVLVQCDGYEVKTEGDSFFIAFDTVEDAATFCCRAQLALTQADWPDELLEIPQCAPKLPEWRGLRVRMGIHIGEPTTERNLTTRRMDYFGPAVNRASRVAGLGNGGTILLSHEARVALNEELCDGEEATKTVTHTRSLTTRQSIGTHLAEFKVDSHNIEQVFVGYALFKGISRPQRIHALIHPLLAGRQLPSLSSGPSAEPSEVES